MRLLIVESPAKAATLAGFLGPGYRVRATEGHVCDLPDEGLGVDVDGAFEAQWRTAKGKRNVLAALRRDAEGCERIFLATDPDREGEAIAHHLAEALARTKVPAARVAFGEVTEEAVRAAVARPRPLDAGLVAAQQARRVVDRLVGYAVSRHLQHAVRSPRPLSAGRVQTAALRLLCEREHALADFAPTPTWGVEAEFQTEGGEAFSARLVRAHGQPLGDGALDEGAAWQLAEAAMLEPYAAGSCRRTSERLPPPPPFTTAALLQAASEQLGLRPAEALRAAQQLYEGVELDDDVRVGLLTYPRTDGVRLARSAVAAIRHVIARDLGTDYLPDRPAAAPAKAAGRPQEAHEAIRPVAFERTPKAVRKYLTPVQYRLYRLVYQRAVASQAIPAVLERTEVESADPGGRFVFRASGARVTARGFLQIEGAEPETSALPALLGKGERLATVRIAQAKRTAEVPERYTEATLIGAMETRGIGRPSTYAATLETLAERGRQRTAAGTEKTGDCDDADGHGAAGGGHR